MALLSLFAMALVGTVVWVFNAEALAVYYASVLGYSPVLVAAVCAVAQCVTYSGLYFGGDRLLRRWRWLREKSERTERRYGQRLRQQFLWLTLLGGLLGVPPAMALMPLAAAARAPYVPVIAIVFVTRLLRFAFLAYAGHEALRLTGYV